MELKVGQKLWAIFDHLYQNRKCLTKDKEYAIHVISSGSGIIVIDDTMEAHGFSDQNIGKYFTTEPPKKERYFIVFYNLNDSGYNHSVSFSQFEYPNKQEIVSIISNESRDLDVGITNIIELNQQDYESWNK